MTLPRFSVVVPAYNYCNMLPTALDSVLSQGRTDVEIVVIDDASTDETYNVAHRYSDRIRYLRNDTNSGHPTTWYRAMMEARGEYIVNLDADDWLLPGYFQAIDRVLGEDVGMVVHSVYDYRVEAEAVELRPVAAKDTTLSAEAFRARLLDRIFFRTPGMLIRRDLAAAAAPPDPRIWNADWEFLLRASRGHGARVIATPLAVYRIHPRSVSGTAKASNERLQKSCRLFLDITRDPTAPGYLAPVERRRFARGIANLYLRIVGSSLGAKDARAALEHLAFAVALAGSEDLSAGLGTAVFFVRAAAERLGKPLRAPKPAVPPIHELLPRTVPHD